MTILVTGSAGMIGSHLAKGLLNNGFDVIGLDKKEIQFGGDYKHYSIDLGDKEALSKVFRDNKIDRIIHLAALAHATGGKKYPKKLYEYLNVECANNIFQVANANGVPVLFISTVDVFGFQRGVVTADTICHPVTIYGKTKYKAEQLLKESDCSYTIFRFSPVYTPEIKRDIQKRIYLKYPKWAYQIGKNTHYEVLSIDKAISEMIQWCSLMPQNEIRIVKDDELLETKKYIMEEKELGNARHIIKLPRWLVVLGYSILRISGKNKYTFLLNKAVHPLRSK